MAFLIAAVFTIQSTLGYDTIPCWNNGANVGAWYRKTISNAGVRANEDFTPVTLGSGVSIAHPMQVITDAGDFLGWGTYRGLGTHNPDATSNCPDDPSAHWHVYIDGVRNLHYFCRVGYGDINGTATDQLFTLRYGDCDGVQKWRAFLNGVRQTCQLIDDDSAAYVAVGGEVVYTYNQQVIDIRYHDLDYYYPATDSWYSWSSYQTTPCANVGYQVDVFAADDVQTVAYP